MNQNNATVCRRLNYTNDQTNERTNERMKERRHGKQEGIRICSVTLTNWNLEKLFFLGGKKTGESLQKSLEQVGNQ